MAATREKEILGKLIGFNTISDGPNRPLIDWVVQYLKDCGLDSKHIHVQLPPKEEPGADIHANLFATIPAADGSTQGGIALCGHTDVVPVAGQKWSTDPFQMVERDGKLYGRGACDMKGYIAAVLALVPELLRRQKTLKKPIHFGLTYSEETNMCGARLILSKLREHQCEGCVIGEPTDMALVVSNKGLCHHIYESKGLAAHSSLQTSGFNALQATSEMLNHLFELRDKMAKEGPFEEGYGIPYTTLCPAMINGGIATNIIPEYCKLNFDIRNIAADNMEDHIKSIAAFVAKQNEAIRAAKAPAGCGAKVEHLNAVPAFAGDKSAAVYKALRAAHSHATGEEKVNYVTEAGYYQPLTPTVVCGPGSIDQAHKPDEFVDIKQLQLCVKVMRDTTALMCGAQWGPSSI